MNVYGITNCDTVKEARQWLAQRGVTHRFVDFKKTPPTREKLAAWCAAAGWQTLLNRRGTTWKKLEPEAQARVIDERSAILLMAANPTAIRRPVVESEEGILRRLRPRRMGAHVPGLTHPMKHTFRSILWSVLGILVSGTAGGIVGWALVNGLGLGGVTAALLAAVAGMVVATAVWLGITLLLRRIGLVE